MFKANAQRLTILRDIREQTGMDQDEAARLCGLQGNQIRKSYGAWENGQAIPGRKRRQDFIYYLWDGLQLRRNQGTFEEVWSILVDEWGWDPLSEAEWHNLTGHQLSPARGGDIEGIAPHDFGDASATTVSTQSSLAEKQDTQPSSAVVHLKRRRSLWVVVGIVLIGSVAAFIWLISRLWDPCAAYADTRLSGSGQR